MKVLKVIHGYPPVYSAGSEVYSQTLCHELAGRGHEVVVFARQEDAYKREYSIEWQKDSTCGQVGLCLVNMAHSRDGYRHPAVDQAFGKLLDQFQPDVVHIGHLSHLSTSIVLQAHARNLPIVFTLHDFWLMCPRGQFLQATNSKGEDLYPACDSQQDGKCARKCYWRYFSSQDDDEDISYWTKWVGKRMQHIKEDILPSVDIFLAPSHYLMRKFLKDFPLDASKIFYLDYGFLRERLENRRRNPEQAFTFGYIGTHKQAKGIFHLIQAFSQANLNGAQLKIWGNPLEPFTSSLRSYISTLNPKIQKSILWMGGYKNHKIVEEVFNHVDAIVVPSIWGENSPLVIHEALEAKVPVITADFGGMKEYIRHEINGLLFTHRSTSHLALQMKRLIKEPELRKQIVKRGYLQSSDGRIPSIEEHTEQIESYYHMAIKRRNFSSANQTGTPAHYI